MDWKARIKNSYFDEFQRFYYVNFLCFGIKIKNTFIYFKTTEKYLLNVNVSSLEISHLYNESLFHIMLVNQ